MSSEILIEHSQPKEEKQIRPKKKKVVKKSTEVINLDALAEAVKKTIINDSRFAVGFSKRYDECITNPSDVVLKSLEVEKSLYNEMYHTTLSCYNASPYHSFNEEEDDNENEEDFEDATAKRFPFSKGRFHTSDKDVTVLLKRAFDIFNTKIKMCSLCNEIHMDISDTCNNCLVIKVFKQCEVKDCAICLEKAEVYCTLPCKHSFHNKCVMGLQSRTCPLCRAGFELPLRRV
ncbi:MAG: RING finger domain-containing protein [Candidatus Colwellbacteria bacterium]|nr:RING finger domain-containing protein [Candidatus Colwellbacteria bacterium]